MAAATIRQIQDIRGAPPNIQRELEFLRAFCYRLLDQVNKLQARIDALPKAASTPAASGADVLISRLITNNTLIQDPADLVLAGKQVEYRLTQDSTGGRVVSWTPQFKGVNALTVGRTANRVSIVRFRKLKDKVYVRIFSVGDVSLA